MPIEASPPSPDDPSLELPAVFANRFVITLTNNGLMRLAYGEVMVDKAPIKFRGAFLCPAVDLEDLISVLKQVVERAKEQQKESQGGVAPKS